MWIGWSIVVTWSRCVNDAVRKFLQIQINTNITAIVYTFVTALAVQSEQLAFGAVQLLWINLILDNFSVLALGSPKSCSTASPTRKPTRFSLLI